MSKPVFNSKQTIVFPSHLVKYVIGTGGSILKDIQAKSNNSKVTIPQVNNSEPNVNILVESVDANSLQTAVKLIQAILDEHKHKINAQNATSKSWNLPAALHKYVIGDYIQTVQKETETKIEFKGDTVTIMANAVTNCDKAWTQLLEQMKKFYWFYDEKTKKFTENNPNATFAEECRKKQNQEAELRNQKYEKSQEAFKKGDKALAKQLSDEGKKHQEAFEKAQKEAAQKIFERLNKSLPKDTMDLHFLQVEEAVQFVTDRIAPLKKGEKLNIITGAGNHSDAEGAKIKPAIRNLVQAKGMTLKEVRNGEFEVTA